MYYYIIVGDFGAWTSYGQCKCDSLQYRSRVCDSEPCVGDYSDNQACDCTPLDVAS